MRKKINIEKTSMYQFSLLNYHINILILEFLKSLGLVKDYKKPEKPKKYIKI